MKATKVTTTNSPTTKVNSKSEMIRSLTFQNFQTHKKTKVTFPPGARIIAFVGTSGSGKSCLMRGLEYLYLLGKCIARYGEDSVLVSAQTGDGLSTCRTSIVDLKGKKVDDHLSILDTQEMGEERSWVKMNKQLPTPFVGLTRIGYLDVEDLKKKFSLNFIGQFDRCLPRDFRPSEISKIFGSVSGRNRVDSAIKATNVAIGRIKAKIKENENLIETADEEIEEVKALIPDVDPDLSEILEEWEELGKIEELRFVLEDRKKEIARLEQRRAMIDIALEGLDLDKTKSEIMTLARIYRLAGSLETFSEANLSYVDSAIEGIDSLGGQVRDYRHLVEGYEEYDDADEAVKIAREQVELFDDKLEDVWNRVRDFLKKHKMCPYSGEKLPKACFDKLSRS